MREQDNGLSGEEIAGIGVGTAGSGTNYVENVVFRGERGHGFAAENSNHLFDKFAGKDAEIVGRDNARNGADRIVEGVHIQSKYCSSGAKCVAECFEDGMFRYVNADNTPMQIEVPSDMHEGALKAMEARIEKGQVNGVSDPAKAKEIIRKGHFTYTQAKNVARFGTVESLTFDAVNGIKLAGYAMGISAALAFAVSIWNGDDLDAALKQACKTGVKVGGLAWISSIVAAQLGRTGFEKALRGSTDRVVSQFGPKAAAWLANSLRSGGSIYGVAAMNHVSKLLRGNLVTGIVTTAILSSVDFIRMFKGRVSGGQVFKNVTVTASGVAGGTAGCFGGAAAGAAIGSAVPGLGTAIGGVIGGVLGALGIGVAASKTATVVLDGFIEDDAEQMLAIMEKLFGDLCVEYLFTEEEARAADARAGPRTVPLSPSAVGVLSGLPRSQNNPWVLSGRKPSTHHSDIDGAWDAIRNRTGLVDVRMHDLRHSFASRALALGQSLPMIGKFLGHRQIETTGRYAHLARESMHEAATRISDSIAPRIL